MLYHKLHWGQNFYWGGGPWAPFERAVQLQIVTGNWQVLRLTVLLVTRAVIRGI